MILNRQASPVFAPCQKLVSNFSNPIANELWLQQEGLKFTRRRYCPSKVPCGIILSFFCCENLAFTNQKIGAKIFRRKTAQNPYLGHTLVQDYFSLGLRIEVVKSRNKQFWFAIICFDQDGARESDPRVCAANK